MDIHSLNESLWQRGWKDTKSIWKSLPFYLFDVFGVLIAGILIWTQQWYWGLGIVPFGMMCAWIGATAKAPIRQRDEARAQLERKSPILLTNREELIRAIATLAQKTIELMNIQGALDANRSPYLIDVDGITGMENAFNEFRQATEKLRSEKLVAGEAFAEPLSNLITFIYFHVYGSTAKLQQTGGYEPTTLTGPDFADSLDDKVEKTIREINRISGANS